MFTSGPGPRDVTPDDPGPWSVVAPYYRGQTRQVSRPDRRTAMTPLGLMLAQPPALQVERIGIAADAEMAGGGPIRVVSGVRDTARAVRFSHDGARVQTISRLVTRSFSAPGLDDRTEDRPEVDPAADLPPAIDGRDLAGDLPAAVTAPDGTLLAVPVMARPSGIGVVILRSDDRALVRWISGAHCAAWSPDGRFLAIGGDWGLFLAERRRPVPEPDESAEPAAAR